VMTAATLVAMICTGPMRMPPTLLVLRRTLVPLVTGE
jgi:hypothetical protein